MGHGRLEEPLQKLLPHCPKGCLTERLEKMLALMIDDRNLKLEVQLKSI